MVKLSQTKELISLVDTNTLQALNLDDSKRKMEAMNIHDLNAGWQFKQTDTEEWLPVPRIPSNVHLDLIAHDKITDPFIGFDELDCQWVAEKSWTYKTILPDLSASVNGQKHVLAFDGLDTFANVKLNGTTILESDNMFIPNRVDVTDRLQKGKTNVLEIEFKSALLEARKIKDAHPEHKWVGFNGEMSRLAVRKAQYHWGWDWGPLLMTCGIWKPVRLESYVVRISDLRVDYTVSKDLNTVDGTITASVEGGHAKQVELTASLDGKLVFKGTSNISSHGTASVEFHVKEPRLWFPHGYGKQALYTVEATVVDGNNALHTVTKKTGFRKAELVQEPDGVGKTFYFRVNNVDIFCGGSDWIPADSLTPRITAEKYRRWLQTMVDGNQVMTRIWGGGIWEDDVFYETCDDLGILVWQDFMFGCGNYPAFPEMRKSIDVEARAQLKRLRHHPSIVIYAGNNEDYQVQEQMGLEYDYADKNPENWLKTDFPARYIYEKILPEAVAAESPHVPYHPGSPWGDGLPTSDPTVGDLHQWNVWHGTQEKYQIFDTLGGRFNSEFGMEAFPHLSTIEFFVGDDVKQLYPQSHMLDFHNKADGHERRIATYLVENFRTSTELGAYVHLTQLSQAEALGFGYRGWRRQWGDKRFCGGALVWQLNDCWPVTSWSIIDYFLRKKPAYYVMRRILAPISICIKRSHHDWSVVHAHPAKTSTYECWIASNGTTPLTSADVELRFISIATGKDIKPSLSKTGIEVVANGTTEIANGVIDNEVEEPHVLAARVWIDGVLVSRDCDWPQPLKYLSFEDRGVEVRFGEGRVSVKARKPVKGLVFEERDGVKIEDSCVDVVPGDEQVIGVEGELESPLGWRFYGQGE